MLNNTVMTGPITIDGAYGEGGGQVLRMALALAAATGRPLGMERIRARRRRPGLAAQHLTAVRAAAAVCEAEVRGDALGSTTIDFLPGGPPRGGDYAFDVAAAREGGSAGAATLVLQTVVPLLGLAAGASTVTVRGGTHVPWSPPFDYARDVWLPVLARFGIHAELELLRWGWYSAGGGEIRARIRGRGDEGGSPDARVDLTERGTLRKVWGRAVAADLPAHIPQRMADRAWGLLTETGVGIDVRPERVRAASPGTGIFLVAEYEHVRAGFSALGRRGRPAEEVAEEAVHALLDHHRSGASVDDHLGDQLILPAALAQVETTYTVAHPTAHLTTAAWLVEQFGLAGITLAQGTEGNYTVTVIPENPGADKRGTANRRE
ncbi:MAG TPA: RNA 3'-terminal phosphate cyclase [bacterium]|jgi:RNA 3'-terminal phosphate cyclase (ATP)